MSLGLREKIIAIICEEWPKSLDNELDSTTIYERLQGAGVEVSDHDVRDVLLQLAQGGAITLVLASTPPPSAGVTIREVSPELCQ